MTRREGSQTRELVDQTMTESDSQTVPSLGELEQKLRRLHDLARSGQLDEVCSLTVKNRGLVQQWVSNAQAPSEEDVAEVRRELHVTAAFVTQAQACQGVQAATGQMIGLLDECLEALGTFQMTLAA